MRLDPPTKALIRLALKEDLGSAGDVTTRNFISPAVRITGYIVAKQSGIVCGLDVTRTVFQAVSPQIRFTPLVRDGQKVRKWQKVAWVTGPRKVLSAERTALNFLQHLSGIATQTRHYVDLIRGARARLYDTRKTLPGWRILEKYAVRCGGGRNHRMGLYDAVMIKDNHLELAGKMFPRAPEVIAEKIRRIRRQRPRLPIIMEAKTRPQIEFALRCGADIILLDNMSLSRLRREINFIRSQSRKTQIEVSGGVSLGGLRAVARLGPDRISVGRITHSAPAMDFSLECHGQR